MTARTPWLGETLRTYLGNATSRRDFRVQMRGPKPFWFFSLYVICMALIGLSAYWSNVEHGQVSIVDVQHRMTEFFNSLMQILAGAICLIAPGLTGTAIVSERQRQSLDLVICAPVEPKYLLVGKMISSYRYTWMLLILALPVVALSVVLGGASWSDVFGCFALLSFHALIYTSLALLISTFASKPASAVVWSLLAVGGLVAASSGIASVAFVGRGNGGDTSFLLSLSPFFTLQTINSSTVIGHFHVPNWTFTILTALLMTRFFLLAAGVILSPLDKRLSANLRITGFAYVALLAGILAFALAPEISLQVKAQQQYVKDGGNPLFADQAYIFLALGVIAWLVLALPLFSTFGADGSRRFWFNGRFNLRHILDGTPAGGLPYLVALTLASFGGVFVGAKLANGVLPGPIYFGAWVWALGFVFLGWSFGQALSSRLPAMKTARALQTTLLIALYGLYPFLLSSTQPAWLPGGDGPLAKLWYLWLFAPLTDGPMFHLAWVYGLAFFVVGIFVLSVATRRMAVSRA